MTGPFIPLLPHSSYGGYHMELRKTVALFVVISMIFVAYAGLFSRNARWSRDTESKIEEIPEDGFHQGTRTAFDRDYLYVYSQGNRGVYRMNKDGSNAQLVLNINPPTCQQMGGAAVSPDGTKFYAKGGQWGWGGGQAGVAWWSTENGQQGTINLNQNPQGKTFGVDREYIYYMSDGCRSNTVVKANFNGVCISQTTIPSFGRQNRNGYGFSVCNGYVWVASSSEWWGWEVDKFNGGNLNNPDVKFNHGGGSYFSLCYDGKHYYHGCRDQMKKFNRNHQLVTTYNVGYRYWIVMTPYIGVAFVDNAVILGDDDKPVKEEPICYARHQKYTLTTEVLALNDLNDPSELKLYLDYNHTNATLCYNWTRGEFFEEQDRHNHVELLLDECETWNDEVEKWRINFTMMFNFTFPHNNHVDCYTNISARTGDFDIDRFPWLFRVEKDMEFIGTPRLRRETRSVLQQGDWVRAGENLTLDNLTVKYTGDEEVFPQEEFFDVNITDREGNVFWDNESSGEEVNIVFPTRNVLDLEEEYTITIGSIPGTGTCRSVFTFEVKMDSEAPLPPLNLLCHARNYNDKQTEYTNEPETYVTWDEVLDYESGLKGYYYSHTDNAGTRNGTFTEEVEVVILDLWEGIVPVYVWCEDMVGNLGQSVDSDILVDQSPPQFSEMLPEDGLWHNKTNVECSVLITDPEGSGVDGNAIEYSVSFEGPVGFNIWSPASLPQSGLSLNPRVEFNFQEGEDNYIKWRARDMSGNGFSESAACNVKIDTTPVYFGESITPVNDWYSENEITVTITLSDQGSGVDPASVEYSISTQGPTKFGSWEKAGEEQIKAKKGGVYEITVTGDFSEGKDNYIMFRATDLVSNPLAESKKFNLKIDTTPVYYGKYLGPENGYFLQEEVVISIPLNDDGIGIDPETVEYSVSKDGPAENKFGSWKKVPSVPTGNTALIIVSHEFDWGRNNYIRFKAEDKLATGVTITDPIEIWINSEPTIIISNPSDRAEYESGEMVTFDASKSFDADGDNLSFYWTSNLTANLEVGFSPSFTRSLAPGKHMITLYVDDGTEHNVSKKMYLTVKKKGKTGGGTDGTETGGRGGMSDTMLLGIIGGAVILLLLILIVVVVIRRRKRSKREEERQQQAAPPEGFGPPHGYGGPASHPYAKGQHFNSMPNQRYAPGNRLRQSPYGAPHAGQPPAQQLPPAQHSQLLQLPPAQGPQPTAAPEALPSAGMQAQQDGQAVNYSLPIFTGEAGTQDLNRMALPPGPEAAMPPAQGADRPMVQQPMEQPAQQPFEQTVQQPVGQPVQQPMEQPAQQPFEQPTQQPFEQPVQQPVEQTAQQPFELPVQQPVELPVQQPVVAPVADPLASPLPQQPPADGPTTPPSIPPTVQPQVGVQPGSVPPALQQPPEAPAMPVQAPAQAPAPGPAAPEGNEPTMPPETLPQTPGESSMPATPPAEAPDAPVPPPA